MREAVYNVLLASLAVVIVGGASGCAPKIGEGQFQCDVNDPGTCPLGFTCQWRPTADTPCCYSESTTTHCGNGIIEPGEECDGPYALSATCRERGYWAGQPTCRPNCTLDESSCLRMVQLTAGYAFGCGRDQNGQLWCWGDASHGQLGWYVYHEEPVDIAAPR